VSVPLHLTETQSKVQCLSQDLNENRSRGASDEAIQASNQQARGAFVIYKPDNLHSTSIQHTAASAGNELPKMLVNNGEKCGYCSRQTFNVEKQLLERCCWEHTTLRWSLCLDFKKSK